LRFLCLELCEKSHRRFVVCVFLGNFFQMLIANAHQLFLRVLARMLDVDAAFMRPATADNKFHSSDGGTASAAGNNKSFVFHLDFLLEVSKQQSAISNQPKATADSSLRSE
jgi:hypothetical protein